jgi:hypothetical protein
MTEPSKPAARRADSLGSRWTLFAAYGALALLVLGGILRVRHKRELEALKKPPEWNLFVPAAIPDPLYPSPQARRVVRWCEALDVIQRKCQRCHGSSPTNGAPISLVTYADTEREYPAGSGRIVRDRMNYVIRHRTMPMVGQVLDPPVEPLEPHEVDTLLVWLEEGAMPFGGEECGNTALPSEVPRPDRDAD